MRWAVVLAAMAVAALAGCATDKASVPAAGHVKQAAAPIDSAVARGVHFLEADQNPDGSWGTGTKTTGFEVYSVVPGSHDAFRVATTALCVMALRQAGEIASHDRGLNYLIHHYQARRDTGDLLLNTWAHIYGLQALSIEMRFAKDNAQRDKIRAAAQWELDAMQKYQTYIGGWNYYDFDDQTASPSMPPTSFQTAAGLVALWEARKSGFDVHQRMIDLAIRRLEQMRLPNGAYLYSGDLQYIPLLPANMVRGSIGRVQSANFALMLWKSTTVDAAKSQQGLDLFFQYHEFIEMGRKRPIPHSSWYQTAPYYYYFGHYYAAGLIDLLGSAARQKDAIKLANFIVPLQEPDGSWWDYPLWDYDKPYGTAFAIMTLLDCQK